MRRYRRLRIGKSLFLGRTERDLERVYDPMRDVILNLEDIGQVAVVAVSPQMRAVSRVDELRRDTHTIARPADRAFEDRSHAKLATNGAHID